MLRDGYQELVDEVDQHKAATAAGADGGEGDEGEEDEEDSWTPEELALLPNVLGALKVAINTISKSGELLGSLAGGIEPTSFDKMVAIGSGMCADSDDMVLSAYAPIDRVEVGRVAGALRGKCEALLAADQALLTESKVETIPKWLPMLARAAEHNEAKLRVT
jgi:hypothetical protein